MAIFEITPENIHEIDNVDGLLLVTHPGIFHGDDVMTTALIKAMVLVPCVIVRTESDNFEQILSSGNTVLADDSVVGVIRYDIGNGAFDHHQPNNERHMKDDTPFAAFGKIWRALGPLRYSEEIVDKFENSIVVPIDGQDNGHGTTNPLSILISQFNPNWDEPTDSEYRDNMFLAAVDISERFLRRYFHRVESVIRADGAARDEIKKNLSGNGKVLLMERSIPLGSLLQNEFTDILFIIGPSARVDGEWNATSVRDTSTSTGPRHKKLFPSYWLSDRPKGCRFLHSGLFMASFDSRENALAAVLSIID